MTLEQGQVINEEKVIWIAVSKTWYRMTANLMMFTIMKMNGHVSTHFYS
jgi:hypothetical protein